MTSGQKTQVRFPSNENGYFGGEIKYGHKTRW